MDFAGASALLIGTGTHLPGSDLPDIPAVARTLDDLRAALLERCGLGEVRIERDLATPLELGAVVSEAAASAAGPLIVYYVGHGLVSRRGALYLAAGVTRSGPLHLEHTGLPYDTVRRYLLDNVDAPVAVVLDCCFSGRAIEGMSPPWDEVAGLAEITGAYVLTSAGRSEPSFAPAGLAHTAFSGALLRLLAEGIPGGPPYLSLQDVHRQLSRVLPAGGFPRPRARSTGRVGELRLAPNPAHGQGAEGVRLSPPGRRGGSPYKGLAAFGEADAELFFGRERLVATLVRELAERHADPAPLIVTGASGSGKSSLLRAGLVPALAQGGLGFPATAAVITPGEPVPDVDVLIVDQVEEAELPEAVFARDGLLVLGVRADFLGRCAEDPRLRTALERGQVVVGPMTEQELREAVERPALAHGLTLEPGLVELLLRDLGTEPGRLPLLSHALLATWQQRRGPALTVAGYRQTGGIAGALAATADDVLAGLDSPDTARAIFRRLVRVGEGTDDTRRRVPLEELAFGREVIDAFAADDARLLTLDSDTVVITHEALLTAWPALRSWLDADRAGMLIEQHLVEAAASWDGDPGGLYRGSRLALAREYATGRALGPAAERFVAASVGAAERQARRRVLVTGVLSGLLVVALIASVVAVLKYQDAERARKVAAGRALIFQADAVRQADPAAALRASVAAVRANPGVETEAALAADAAGMAFRSRLTGMSASVNAVAVSPDGTRALTGDWAGRLLYWDLTRSRRLAEIPSTGKGSVYGVRFLSPTSAVVVWRDVGPEIWDLSGPTLVGRLGGPAYAADVSGSRVAVAGLDGVSLWDLSGRRLSRFPGAAAKVALAGDRLLAGDPQGSARLWNLRDGSSMRLPAPVTDAQPNLGVALSRDGRTAVAGDRVWDVSSGRPRLAAFLVGHDSWIADLAFAPGDQELVSASDDQTAIVWDLAVPSSPRLVRRLTGHQGPVLSVATGPGGLVLTGSGDQSAIAWRVATPPHVRVLPGTPQAIAYGGARLLTRDADDTGTLWEGGRAVTRFPDAAGGVALSRDGTVALVGGKRGADLSDMSGVRDLAVGRRVWSVALSASGRRALVGGPDGVVLWASGREVVLPGTATAVGLSEDGLFGVTGSGGRLVPWDLRDPYAPRQGEPVEAHRGDVLGLAVRDGRVLSGGADRKAALWEITGPASLRAAGTLLGHLDSVGEVALNGDLAATAGTDETVRVWLIRDPAGPRQIQLLSRAGIGLAFGPGTYSIFASNVQGGVIRWDFRSSADAMARPLATACALIECSEGQTNGGE
ncbi:hypothetical protein ACIBHX_16900 [Nonomuraea sp. NPDC050536]|uniref:caspase, EACC1-associated type n=1 Tax=Nonomuraea sp. NPDC050536 TaxID=3364366 RepID=UPI0037C8A286